MSDAEKNKLAADIDSLSAALSRLVYKLACNSLSNPSVGVRIVTSVVNDDRKELEHDAVFFTDFSNGKEF